MRKAFKRWRGVLAVMACTLVASAGDILLPPLHFRPRRRNSVLAEGGLMPITYEIDRERALVRTSLVGFVTFADVMEHFATLEKDPRRTTGPMNVLLDLRGLTSTPETGQLRRAAKRIDPEQTDLQYGVCAIVATDPAAISTGKLFAVFARDRFRASTVVSTVDEADRWLREHAAPQRSM